MNHRKREREAIFTMVEKIVGELVENWGGGLE